MYMQLYLGARTCTNIYLVTCTGTAEFILQFQHRMYPDTAVPLDLEVPRYLPLIQVHLEVPYLSRYTAVKVPLKVDVLKEERHRDILLVCQTSTHVCDRRIINLCVIILSI